MSSCMRSSLAPFASGVVMSFVRSNLRSTFVASARTNSGACSNCPNRTCSAHVPCEPVSIKAAISTDESTTTLNVDQRFGSRVFPWRRRESASQLFFCAPVVTTRLPMDERPIFPVPCARIPASICPATPRGQPAHREPFREHRGCLFGFPCIHNAIGTRILQAVPFSAAALP